MVNISISMNPEKYQAIYAKLQNEKEISEKATMSDIVNSLIQKGLAYEALISYQNEQKKIAESDQEEK